MTDSPPLEARVLFSRSPTAADPGVAWQVAGAVERGAADRVARVLERLGVRAPLAGEPGYPAALRDLPDAPRVLFVRGVLPELSRAVTVVGSRAATPYGMARAGALGADLARLGYTVVSGLARGIDGAAHRGALEAGGASVAVLPGGLDAVTPRHHAELAESLCARGGLLSERASGPPPFRATFLERNRLIAALSAATVVVEAAARSGALATAACARRLGRPVLAVPGDVDRETSRGPHALIRAGATLCESAGDVLKVLGSASSRGGGATPGARLGAALRAEPRGVGELAAQAGLAVDETLALLLQFEWAGAAVALPGQRWRRAPS
jgi:DNA processing protein